MFTKCDEWVPQGLDDLEPRAWEALRESERTVLVTAGAGAGKTEFLAQKATYLLQTGLCPAPKRILAISFKRDAARNLEERVQKRCPPEQARRFNSMTFDAFTKGFLDRFRQAVPAPFSPPPNYRIVFPSAQDYEAFLQDRGRPDVDRKKFEKALSKRRLPFGETRDLISEYWRAQYNDYDQVLLSFSMINRLVEWLLRENAAIRRALHLTYPFVFLDEFQDTTHAQFEFMETAFDGSSTIFTAVGDDKQRVMLWAGAMADGFDRFKTKYDARHMRMISNWRSHEDLVRIQHVVARLLDPHVEYPEARATREVDGDIAAIWEFEDGDEEGETLAQWITQEVQAGIVEPHDTAILVRARPNDVEYELTPTFARYGLKLRNVSRNVGDISIQDLLGEDLTNLLLPLLRLGASERSPENWSAALRDMQYLERVAPDDDVALARIERRLQEFVRVLRHTMKEMEPDEDTAKDVANMTLDFLGTRTIRQTFVSYQRKTDFERIWNGFKILLSECATDANGWTDALDRFEGRGQVTLMTIHKSKGLEFHTMIFFGLDNKTWWSLTTDKREELNTFFVALTRAEQRAFFTFCVSRGEPVVWIEELLASVDTHRVPGRTILEAE